MNEADASARYANEKTLVNIKQDSMAEQQRFRQQINALEEELEVSLCQINRLNAERNKCTQQLEEVQTVREELEHKLQVTVQRHQKELKQLQSSCEEHHQTILREKSQEWDENRKRFDLELKKKTEEYVKRNVEMEQTLGDVRSQLDQLKDEYEHLQQESSAQQSKHQEELAQCVKHFEMNKELLEIKQAHCKELKDSLHEMKTAKRQALTEMKLCYVERIDALQESLSLSTKENNAFKDKLFQLEYHHQQQQQKQRQQKQLEHKQSQTAQLANEFGEQWIQKMCETVRAEFGDWDRENCGLWEARFAELRNEANCVADKLRSELQTEQEAVYRAKEETNKILKKIALAEVYQALDTRKLLDEKLQHFHTRCDEQLEKERADLRDQLQQALYHAFNQIDKWMRDWAESVECTIQIIKAAERASIDGMASKMKEMR
ncbi:hypothetical protein EG68_02028 [Paragonimus skrjabini miyazakii]|uniref:Uncharacterized protein n=1 Tax=Paragonimus skrjabini miyazakii TaxID=59628 RepID=A0A8S9Z085_9TREM|nr:hypothetical protein EG68_02028 [Paragonimus skrjabini miyazakii]